MLFLLSFNIVLVGGGVGRGEEGGGGGGEGEGETASHFQKIAVLFQTSVVKHSWLHYISVPRTFFHNCD